MAGDVWRLEVLEAIVVSAKREPIVTVEDITPLAPPTLDLQAIGVVMLEAQRPGLHPRMGG
jgi:hypothetical protein